MNIYQKHGFDSRRDYLESLAFDYDLEVEDVFNIAGLLGPSEDFDGLLSELEDVAQGM